MREALKPGARFREAVYGQPPFCLANRLPVVKPGELWRIDAPVSTIDTPFVFPGADMNLLRSSRQIASLAALFSPSFCIAQTQPAAKTDSSAQSSAIKMPETTPGKLFGDWLAMCSAPNLEQFTKWTSEHTSSE